MISPLSTRSNNNESSTTRSGIAPCLHNGSSPSTATATTTTISSTIATISSTVAAISSLVARSVLRPNDMGGALALLLLRFVLVTDHHNSASTLFSPTLRLVLGKRLYGTDLIEHLAIFLSDDERISWFRSGSGSMSST